MTELPIDDQMFSLIENTKPDSQMRLLAEIFESKPHIPISKSDLETNFVINWLFKNITFPIEISSTADIFEYVDKAPGDVQRQLRTFYDRFKEYGLSYSNENKNVMYTYIPKLKSECEDIIIPAPRNLFNNETSKDDFIHSRGRKCELCHNDNRLAIDHWRAHSVYNINDKRIAVLLCEQCNNIHHNFDASHCIEKNMTNIQYIKNWVHIENKIRSLGFEPNKDDLKTQNENIMKVNAYYSSLSSPLKIGFWEGLFH